MARPGILSLNLLGSSFCTIRYFRILSNPCHHSRAVRIPYLQMARNESLTRIFSSAFSVRRNMNPVSTRIELGCLGFLGTFWIGGSLSWPVPVAWLNVAQHLPRS